MRLLLTLFLLASTTAYADSEGDATASAREQFSIEESQTSYGFGRRMTVANVFCGELQVQRMDRPQ